MLFAGKLVDPEDREDDTHPIGHEFYHLYH